MEHSAYLHSPSKIRSSKTAKTASIFGDNEKITADIAHFATCPPQSLMYSFIQTDRENIWNVVISKILSVHSSYSLSHQLINDISNISGSSEVVNMPPICEDTYPYYLWKLAQAERENRKQIGLFNMHPAQLVPHIF